MTSDEARADTPTGSGLTLTQVLNLERDLCLYGRRITDLSPRGDLGLGLDPEGPVGFAMVRAFRRAGGFTRLAKPLVLSVFGEGQRPDAADRDAEPGERLWIASAADRALRIELQHGTLTALLAEGPA
jgi:hypothetical protein